MITNSFDNRTPAINNPRIGENAVPVDACIVTFSHEIERFAAAHYPCEQVASIWFATGETPIYRFEYRGHALAFYRTYVGAPACVATVEDSLAGIRTKNYVFFGGAGCLNREIAHGRVMVPTAACRDEGTSYHYAPAADYIAVKNAAFVADFMRKNGLPCVEGKTWTTDSFYRETRGNFEKRRAEGCISVEMECAALQAMCDFRALELYMFLTSGDLLDAPEWDARRKENDVTGTQHDAGHFDIALELAVAVAERP